MKALTPREVEIAELVAEGLSQKAIGHRLQISARTVENHIRNAAVKLDMDVAPMKALALYVLRGNTGFTEGV